MKTTWLSSFGIPSKCNKYFVQELSLLRSTDPKVSLAVLVFKNRLLCNVSLYRQCLFSAYGHSKRLFDLCSVIHFHPFLPFSFFFWGGEGGGVGLRGVVISIDLGCKGDHPEKFLMKRGVIIYYRSCPSNPISSPPPSEINGP